MEQFLLLALFVVVALANYFVRWLKSRTESRAPDAGDTDGPATLPPSTRRRSRPSDEPETYGPQTLPLPTRRRARPPDEAETYGPEALPRRIREGPRLPGEPTTGEPAPRPWWRPPADVESERPAAMWPPRAGSRPVSPSLPAAPPSGELRQAAPVPPVRVRQAARRRFGRRADLRQAIALMAVLGPCRGLESEETVTPSAARR